MARHFPTGYHCARMGSFVRNMSDATAEVCPSGGAGGWSPWFKNLENDPVPLSQSTSALLETGYEDGFIEFYKEHIDWDPERNITEIILAFPLGARWSVSKKRIHQRSRGYYETLLDLRTKNIDPRTGSYLEAMWYDVFHPDRLQSFSGPPCELPLLDDSRIVTEQEMYEIVQRILDARGVTYDYVKFRLTEALDTKRKA
uniref:Uncharacterized protein n=1 Tax=Lotharella oceanica TaxID=641309 RepID=A0A7S2U437_9EUKA|mmetsp:Transcript_7609/g.14903  ORF Transcript_7609/g.14903 Transcript_7609/m.14903 type:complete len:200 (+) Transcript_7609:1-600(+)